MIVISEINRQLKNHMTVTADVPTMGRVEITKVRCDYQGRTSVQVGKKFYNVEESSIRVSEPKFS